MANFDIKQNLKVEMLLPDSDGNTFILGLSELGGTDLLGGLGVFFIGSSLLGGDDVLGDQKAFRWFPIECETAKADISVGGSVKSSIYFQPEPASARITIQSYTFDPTRNKNVRANAQIRIRLETLEIDRTLFNGYIDTIDVTYYPNGLNLININAFDFYKILVNTRLPLFDTTGLPAAYATPGQVLTEVMTELGRTIYPGSIAPEGKLPKTSATDAIANTFINDAIQVGLAVVWVDQDTEQLVVIPRPTTVTDTSNTFVIGNNHPAQPEDDPYHLCLAEINVNADADDTYNSLKVIMSTDDTKEVLVENQDLIEIYGQSPIDISINAYDETELARWALAVFGDTPTQIVDRVGTLAIDRRGNLTPAALINPGTRLGVSYNKDQISIEGYYTITKVSHTIDVDNWFTKFELWKESK